MYVSFKMVPAAFCFFFGGGGDFRLWVEKYLESLGEEPGEARVWGKEEVNGQMILIK